MSFVEFCAFVEPPVGSTLEAAMKMFSEGAATAPRLSEDAPQIRKTVLESLRRDGAPADASGPWWERLVEAETDRIRSALARLESQPPHRPAGEPNPVLLAYAFMTLCRFRRLVPDSSLEDAIRAVAVEIGPGVSVAETRAAIAYWVVRLSGSAPRQQEALLAVHPVLERLDLGHTPLNVSVSPEDLGQLRRSLGVPQRVARSVALGIAAQFQS